MKFWSYIRRLYKDIRGRQIDMKEKILNMKEVEFLPEKIFI